MLKDVTDEHWDPIMNVNLKGSFNCMRAEIQRMEEDASIINASSMAGLRGYPAGSVYCASKVCATFRFLQNRSTLIKDTIARHHWSDQMRRARRRSPEHSGQLHRAWPYRYADVTVARFKGPFDRSESWPQENGETRGGGEADRLFVER